MFNVTPNHVFLGITIRGYSLESPFIKVVTYSAELSLLFRNSVLKRAAIQERSHVGRRGRLRFVGTRITTFHLTTLVERTIRAFRYSLREL